MTFTLGRGNEVVVAAVRALQHLIVGSKYDDIVAEPGRLLGAAHLRKPAPMDRSGERRDPSRDCRDR